MTERELIGINIIKYVIKIKSVIVDANAINYLFSI